MKKNTVILTLSLLALAASANADPWPHRKPGLWQMTMTMQNSRMPPLTSKYCIDAATEDALMNSGQSMMQKACSKRDVHVSGGNGTIDTVCKFGKYTQTAHAIVTFTGNTAYQMQTRDHMDPPMPYGGADHSSTIDARWVGACPPGMKPGDIVTANGMHMNMGGTMSGMGMGHMGSRGH